MNKPLAVISLLAALGTMIGVLVAVVGLPYGRVSTNAFAAPIHDGTPAPAGHFAIDCDPVASGVQSSCNLVNDSGVFVVDAVFADSSASGTIGSARVTIRNPGTHFTAPFISSAGEFNSNPDFNEAGPGASGTWNCDLVPPSNNKVTALGHTGPPSQMSELSCFVSAGEGPAHALGAEIVIADVLYSMMSGALGPSVLTFGDSLVADRDGIDLINCYGVDSNPGGGDDQQCFPATVRLVDQHDPDGDGRGEFDNCPFDFNPNQENNDRNFIDLPPSKPYDDATLANSDVRGDACDTDDDNDGLLDVDETAFPIPNCPSATASTNPLVADSDGDRTLDGAECMLGFDPASATSAPPIGPIEPDADNDLLPDAIESILGSDPEDVDTDNDGVLDGVEFRYYNTSPLVTNTDQFVPAPFFQDTCSDGKEIASINGDNTVNTTDLQQIAASTGSSSSPQYLVNMDMNKNGQINVVDLQFAAAQFGNC